MSQIYAELVSSPMDHKRKPFNLILRGKHCSNSTECGIACDKNNRSVALAKKTLKYQHFMQIAQSEPENVVTSSLVLLIALHRFTSISEEKVVSTLLIKLCNAIIH